MSDLCSGHPVPHRAQTVQGLHTLQRDRTWAARTSVMAGRMCGTDTLQDSVWNTHWSWKGGCKNKVHICSQEIDRDGSAADK